MHIWHAGLDAQSVSAQSIWLSQSSSRAFVHDSGTQPLPQMGEDEQPESAQSTCMSQSSSTRLSQTSKGRQITHAASLAQAGSAQSALPLQSLSWPSRQISAAPQPQRGLDAQSESAQSTRPSQSSSPPPAHTSGEHIVHAGCVAHWVSEQSVLPSQSSSTPLAQSSAAPGFTAEAPSLQSVPPHVPSGDPSPSWSRTEEVHVRLASVQRSIVQAEPSSHAKAAADAHPIPATQTSAPLQNDMSAHRESSGVTVHAPVASVHESMVQEMPSLHATIVPPTQVPAGPHVSTPLHAIPSSQTVASVQGFTRHPWSASQIWVAVHCVASGRLEQRSRPTSQASTVHATPSSHRGRAPGMQTPPEHASTPLQNSPSSQSVFVAHSPASTLDVPASKGTGIPVRPQATGGADTTRTSSNERRRIGDTFDRKPSRHHIGRIARLHILAQFSPNLDFTARALTGHTHRARLRPPAIHAEYLR